MRPQQLFLLAILAAAGIQPASAADVIIQSDAIRSDAELAESAALTPQDFTGGVGQSGDDASAVIIQMAQPSAGTMSGNAPSNYAYVRVPAPSYHQ